MSTIAAVIPAYNEEAVIVDALESIAMQERRPDQIIVVDDGSRDATVAKVEQWSRETGLAVNIVQKPNGGLPSARNAGFRRATTEYLALLDADDIWHPNHLATLERGMTAGAVLCFGIAQVVDMSGNVVKYFPGARIDKHWVRDRAGNWAANPSDTYSSLVSGSYIAVSSTLISRAATEAIGLMDESMRMIEDTDFWLRLSRLGTFIHVPTLTCAKRVHSRNMTNPRNALQLDQWIFRVLCKMLRSRRTLRLSDDEVRETVSALTRIVPQLLYQASASGVRAYSRAWLDIMEERVYVRAAMDPRHLLRAVVRRSGSQTSKVAGMDNAATEVLPAELR